MGIWNMSPRSSSGGVDSHGAECGRWLGRDVHSYDDSALRGIGPSTPSQTRGRFLGCSRQVTPEVILWPRVFAGW